MEKCQFDGQLRRQCMSLPEMRAAQIAGLRKGLENTIPDEELKKIRKVILTGCGDSYLAARAALPAFRHYAGSFASDFRALRNIDVARHISLDEGVEVTLIIAISASGSPARIEEVLRRGKQHGCKTLIVTNNAQSRGAEAADYVFCVHTPAFPGYGPGCRNYYASLAGLFALAARMGIAKGNVSGNALEELFGAIQKFTAAFGCVLPEIDDEMFRTAQDWREITSLESIGDYSDFSTAAFIAAKFVEADGKFTAQTDSEDWCHVNYFAHHPEQIGTLIVSTKEFMNYGRVKEMVHTACGIGRPVLLITTGKREDYPLNARAHAVTVPVAPDGYRFLGPMLNHLPGSILASYLAAMDGEPYFRGEEAPNRLSPIGTTITTSEIEVV